MTAITREMLVGLEQPQDIIKEENGVLVAEVDIYEFHNGVLVPVRKFFKKQIGEVLSPFFYLKPHIGDDLLSPETQWEDKPREGYQVILRVGAAARMANHIDAIRNALVMAVKNDKGVWETRYFPEGNLKKETWEEGNALLNINE